MAFKQFSGTLETTLLAFCPNKKSHEGAVCNEHIVAAYQQHLRRARHTQPHAGGGEGERDASLVRCKIFFNVATNCSEEIQRTQQQNYAAYRSHRKRRQKEKQAKPT